jgi:hypothetical protein
MPESLQVLLDFENPRPSSSKVSSQPDLQGRDTYRVLPSQQLSPLRRTCGTQLIRRALRVRNWFLPVTLVDPATSDFEHAFNAANLPNVPPIAANWSARRRFRVERAWRQCCEQGTRLRNVSSRRGRFLVAKPTPTANYLNSVFFGFTSRDADSAR